MDTCSVETGLLRKHACGHKAITHCGNCEQPLCNDHAVPQLNEGGHRTGKFMCNECIKALKSTEKGMAAAALVQQQRKQQAAYKAVLDSAKAPPPVVKKPAAPAAAPAAAEAKPAEAAPLEFTPKDGKLEYTSKPDNKGSDYKE